MYAKKYLPLLSTFFQVSVVLGTLFFRSQKMSTLGQIFPDLFLRFLEHRFSYDTALIFKTDITQKTAKKLQLFKADVTSNTFATNTYIYTQIQNGYNQLILHKHSSPILSTYAMSPFTLRRNYMHQAYRKRRVAGAPVELLTKDPKIYQGLHDLLPSKR